MMRRFLLLLRCALPLGLALSCTNAPVSGPSTEQGNPQIVAVVLDAEHKPVAGAAVTPYLNALGIDSVAPPVSATQLPYAITDNAGRCVFSQLPSGTYSLKASDQDGTRSAFHSGVVLRESEDTTSFDTLRLERPGLIYGTVVRGGVSASQGSNNQLGNGAILVIVQEIALSCITPADGRYQFPVIPAGSYTIMYYATNGFYTARETVSVMPGGSTAMDTVSLRPLPSLLPPTGLTADYDTAAAAVGISWHKVDYSELRWYELERVDLSGPFDTTVTIAATDTSYADDISAVASGTVLYYVVRSVDNAFNRSANAGPVTVKRP